MATYAHFETSLGNFTVELFDTKAPKTVANFVGLVEGTKEWKHPKTQREAPDTSIRRHRLSSRHQGLRDSGRRSAQELAPADPATTSRTSSIPTCATIAPASCRWPTPARTPTAASSSSRSARRRTSIGWPLGLRRRRQGPRCGGENRHDADRPQRSPRHARRDEEGHDRAEVITVLSAPRLARCSRRAVPAGSSRGALTR